MQIYKFDCDWDNFSLFAFADLLDTQQFLNSIKSHIYYTRFNCSSWHTPINHFVFGSMFLKAELQLSPGAHYVLLAAYGAVVPFVDHIKLLSLNPVKGSVVLNGVGVTEASG